MSDLNRPNLPPVYDDEDEEEEVWPPSPMPVPPYVILPKPAAERREAAAEAQPSAQAAPAAPAQPAQEPQAPPKGSKVSPELAELGARIKAAREAKGLTQLAVARAVGRSRSFIALVEQGRRRLSEEDLRKVSELLGL